MTTNKIGIFLLAAVMLYACESAEKKQERISLLTSFEQLMDSVHIAFDSITTVEKRKFFLAKRIADDLQFDALVPLTTISDLRMALKRAESIAYTQTSIRDSNLIDTYDLAMDSLANQITVSLHQVIRLEQYPVLIDMEQEFMTLRESTLPLRIYHDDFAIRATMLLRTLKTNGHKDFASVLNMPEPPLFQLAPI
jgi:hypothetical protein